ncbi:MAG: leucyl aminopeptidase family protein [Minisyncoccia bacterium]
MQFISSPKKGFVPMRFIEGSLSRFSGSELFVATGQDAKATPSKAKESPFKPEPLNRRKFILQMRKVVSLAKQNRALNLDVDFKDIKSLAPAALSDFEIGEIAGCAFLMADYEHNTFKKKPKEGFGNIEAIAIRNQSKEAKKGFSKGRVVAEEVNACRELSNTPGANMTPKILASAAKKAVAGTKATVKILSRAEMKRLGMGAVLAMAQGSAEEPQFITLEYWGKGKLRGDARSQRQGVTLAQGSSRSHLSAAPLVLIGKGVTFDTGGLNVKGGEHMYEMHMDMSGGAAVIHAIALAAKLKLQVNVVGLVPAVENSVSGSAIHPGDIVKGLSQRTIEILNTDAEGRVILSDAITYAKRYDPAAVAEASTLTGAALVALGQQYSAVLCEDETFRNRMIALGEESGDYVWPMPMGEEFDGMVKGHFGDVPNISTEGNSRYGGVIAGGMFLREFAKDLQCPFAHLDIAPRMTAAPNEFLAKGAAGAPVRLFLKLTESFQK